MAERSEVLAHARKVHAEGIKKAANARKSALNEEAANASAEEESQEDADQENKGPKQPRWMLLYKAKFESYSKLLSKK